MEIVLTRGERFKEARVSYNRNGKQTMKTVEKAAGVSASCIKDLENDDCKREVGYEKIAKLAEHYGVSADWLLGLHDIRSADLNIQAICKMTGLSCDTVSRLLYIHSSGSETEKLALDLINRVLSDPKKPALLSDMERYIKGSGEADTVKLRSGEVLPVGELYSEFLMQNIRAALDEYRNRESGITETTVVTVDNMRMEGHISGRVDNE